jgi:hypothetical protein
MGNCSSTSNCNPCGPDFSAINQLATKAGAYARQANTYAINAENSWLEFNALYLGAFAVAPTVDNEGDPLQVGALYWNTVSNTIFAWNGTVWVENGNFNEFTNFSLPSATPVPAANLRTGQEYEIVVVGNTNWTAIGAASATIGVRFTKNAVAATGTGTARVTRDLVTRFADVSNVKDFGAVGDGVADDTDAIQNAIFFGGNNTIYFPSGTYRITKKILIGKSLVALVGDGAATSEIKLDNPACDCAIEFNAFIVGSGLFRNSMINIYLTTTTLTTFQVGVRLERPASFCMINCAIACGSKNIEVKGGSNCFYNNCRFNGNATVPTDHPDTGAVEIQGLTDEGTVYSYTHLFVNCNINSGKRPILIRSNDYITFSNCYVNAGETGGVLIENDGSATNGIYNNNFENIYFDRVTNTNPNAIAIEIRDFGSPPAGSSLGTKISNCVFGDWDVGVSLSKVYDPQIIITGCRFDACRKTAIEIEGRWTNAVITGNMFFNNSRSVIGSSCIDINDVHSVVISGNVIAYNEALTFAGPINAITLSGTIDSAAITGNTIQKFPLLTLTDLNNTANLIEFVVSGNSSDNSSNTIVGNIIGNRANSNPVSLDWYEEVAFNPTLTFGGNAVDLVIANRAAKATRIGDRVFFNIYLQLSNKGTSTGNAVVGGLPFQQSSSYPFTYTISCNGLNAAIGDANLDAISNLGTEINLRKQGGGTTVSMTDADFTNTTFLYLSGNYVAA